MGEKLQSESESHSFMSDSLQSHGLYSPWNSPGQNTGVHRLSLLQGIFPTQGSNPGLLHCRRILYLLIHKGSPNYVLLTDGRLAFDPWVWKISWRRERLSTPVFWSGEFHGLYSPWGRKELDRTEHHSSLSHCPYIHIHIVSNVLSLLNE